MLKRSVRRLMSWQVRCHDCPRRLRNNPGNKWNSIRNLKFKLSRPNALIRDRAIDIDEDGKMYVCELPEYNAYAAKEDPGQKEPSSNFSTPTGMVDMTRPQHFCGHSIPNCRALLGWWSIHWCRPQYPLRQRY